MNVSTKHMKDDIFSIVLLPYVISPPHIATLLASPYPCCTRLRLGIVENCGGIRTQKSSI